MHTIFSSIYAENARRRWTLHNFCEKLCIGRTTFYRWLNKGEIPSQYLPKIANLYDMTTDELIGYKSETGGDIHSL